MKIKKIKKLPRNKKPMPIKDYQKEVIIQRASKLFLSKNINDVTIESVAHEAKIGEATLYRYYKKKENLVIKSAIYIVDEIIKKYFNNKDIESNEDGYCLVSTFLDMFLTIYKEEHAFLHFIDEFDSYVSLEEVPLESLNEYNAVYVKIFLIFNNLYLLGKNDGSITNKISSLEYYHSVIKTLFIFIRKLSKTPIIVSDLSIPNERQIEIYLDMAKNFLKE